jgi:hypothetical protein
MLGTVTTATSVACGVTLDGATTETLVTIPADLKGTLMQSAAVGARVMGARVGSRFLVTEVISGGAPTEWVHRATGLGGLVFYPVLALDVPAGVLTAWFQATGYNTSGTFASGSTIVQIDGVNMVSPGAGFGFNQNGVHLTMNTFVARGTVAAGSHTISVAVVAVADSNDYSDLYVRWDPV